MEIPKEISFKGFEKPEIPDFSNGNSMIEVGKDKIESLKNSIKEIKSLVEEREQLSQNFLKEGDEIKLEIDNFLIENESSSKNLEDRGFTVEKNSLRNKKIEISEHQLNEKINCWKDIALLKKELRQNEKELTEKEARLKEINDLMSEN
jgi:hypothetical protein